ncbi:hypothetical protein GALMADRAFT_210481 [Galerina marginata CBS 339.88]|uniref:Protein root UVB sensitive/RUS domain-containing protein n=1 Tax=Galerina marginata (strain CBS 339.88) TaxID=685588 RepID=A0A067T068_GALM3|nr:hypothetical protein GALMADRAFT_210481 [Galerina marginata CBS 339.88]
MGTTVIHEREENGRISEIHVGNGTVKTIGIGLSEKGAGHIGRLYVIDLLTRVFLPSGYPNTVSPDLPIKGRLSSVRTISEDITILCKPTSSYQILNALQAFCNSLASLLSSRAILQGFGVGDPTATPTRAMLLTVLQDVFGRLTTILSAYIIGSSLYPEAKTYRLLADLLNDTAVILDTLSPLLNTFPIPGLRVSALCLSASFKALCGICAGGSKAAITMHFATPLEGRGDVGDLNAKDGSKETVLALLGMLLGTLIVPYLSTSWTTYTSLFILVGLHLGINYFGVRGLVLRSLNRQRLGIAWLLYQQSSTSKVPTPSRVADMEGIFGHPAVIRDVQANQVIGHCTIGSSFSQVLRQPCPPEVLDLFNRQRYIIWFDHRCVREQLGSTKRQTLHGLTRLHIFLKEGYTGDDQLRAWVHAVEVCRSRASASRESTRGELEAREILQMADETVTKQLTKFVTEMQAAGWNTDECAIMTGSPDAVVTRITVEDRHVEEKKNQ